MQQSCLVSRHLLGITLILALGGVSAAEADDFTIGLKAWGVSMSVDNLDGDDEIFFPGFYFSWGINDRLWLSAGYLDGEVDFAVSGSTTTGSFDETDSDIIIGWSFAKVDVGVGYRFSEFTTNLTNFSLSTESSGPMVFLGGGNLFGQSRWGYYWGLAYMFEDLEDDDGSQEHFNGEAGLSWTSQKNLSVLFGYRYKEYSGDGTAGLTFDGPVVNLAYTFR